VDLHLGGIIFIEECAFMILNYLPGSGKIEIKTKTVNYLTTLVTSQPSETPSPQRLQQLQMIFKYP
jgi:hypothetical protein